MLNYSSKCYRSKSGCVPFGKQGWKLMLKPLLDQNWKKKRFNLWSNTMGCFLFVFNWDEMISTENTWNILSCSTGWGLVCILIFWVLLIVLLISFLVLLLFRGFWYFIIKMFCWGSGLRCPLTERVNPVWSVSDVSAVCWASHIACGTDLLFVFFF